MRRSILLALVLTTSLLTACKDKGATCDKVVDHIVGLMPAEMAKGLAGGHDAMIQKCEKEMTDAERTCALAAKGLDEVSACRAKK